MVNIDILDGSNYFKGLLLLIRKDHKISDSEAELMKIIGRSLGLERRFCEETIRDILENKYISDSPPKFSSDELAKKFLRDGLRLAAADSEIHDLEEQWLESVADVNGIGSDWVTGEKKAALGGTLGERFEALDLHVRYNG
ncbi:MAG TPA: hypothetical protein VI932_11815 [Bacteroidota bacterium]|nr:hypothetical protein [Bacteroidota bacterium]